MRLTYKTKSHRWKYLNQPMTIQHSIGSRNINFTGAIRVDFCPEKYNVRLVSKVQKIMNQKLFNHLTKTKSDNANYLVVIDAPVKPSGDKVFIEMNMTFKPPYIDRLKDWQPMCEEYFNEMQLKIKEILE